MRPVVDFIYNVVAEMELCDGDVVKKKIPTPKVKETRKDLSVSNKSNRSDYMKNFMKKYREEGKDYQKAPSAIKKLRKKQKQKLKEKFDLKKD